MSSKKYLDLLTPYKLIAPGGIEPRNGVEISGVRGRSYFN